GTLADRFQPRGSPGMRIRFVGAPRIAPLRAMVLDPEPARPVALAVERIDHSRLGEVSARLAADGTGVTLAPQEAIELRAQVPPVPAGRVRDYFVVGHGSYSTLAPIDPDAPIVPDRLSLALGSSNPIRDRAQFELGIPAPGTVRLDIYDAAGRRVRAMLNEVLPSGYHRVGWDLSDARGTRVQPGVYL